MKRTISFRIAPRHQALIERIKLELNVTVSITTILADLIEHGVVNTLKKYDLAYLINWYQAYGAKRFEIHYERENISGIDIVEAENFDDAIGKWDPKGVLTGVNLLKEDDNENGNASS